MPLIPAGLAHPLLFNGLVLLASLYILFKSADLIVYAISDYAKKLGLSEAIIGLVVVAMAASAPEIISSLTGFLTGQSGVGFGTILGSNMVHAGLALGILCLLGKEIKLEPSIFTKQRFIMWTALMLPFVLAFDGLLSRADGVILVGAFAAYLLKLWQMEGTLGKIKKSVRFKTIWKDVFIFLGCFAALMLSGTWLVFSSIQIAKYFNIPAYFIALTVIGIGTTIPDLSVELRSLYRKHASIGLGDLLGSLIIELILFFGLVAIIKPIAVDISQAMNSVIFLALAITTIMFWMNKKKLTWKHGLILLGLYAVFIAIEIYKII
ncbi:MAG TPA: sodium:calcium antiporter [Candidatus Nanoarchaeia archaeon]|nr:sodium:calcium antiporter [Candidatus Nanoarchaeia archaeon]